MTRINTFIRRKPASNLHHAIRLAAAQGMPMNTFATINFSMTDCPVEAVSVKFGRLRNVHYAHWARRPTRRSGARAHAPTYCWVVEAAGGVTAVHWLLHVPPARRGDFEERLPNWLEAVVGPVGYSNAVQIKDARTPKGAGRYMLKGMEAEFAPFYGIDFVYQGEVHGRRSGYTRNIGPTMKRKLRAAGQYPEARGWRPFPGSVKPPRPELRPS